MADTFTSKQRSEIMRRVKSSRNKSTELKLIQFFKETKLIQLHLVTKNIFSFYEIRKIHTFIGNLINYD